MKRYILLGLILLNIYPFAFSKQKSLFSTCKGTVSCDGEGIAGVVVTDGTHFCQTDDKGNYSFEINPSSSFIYISSPAGYYVSVENSVPQFYKRLDNTQQGIANFQLKKNETDETKHGFIAWADPQIKSKEELPLFKEAVLDLRNLISLNPQIPWHAIGCGDIVGDNTAMFDSTKKVLSETRIPFYQSMGNHDMSYYGRSNETAPLTFEKHFGPAYYSFNKGKIHYIVLNDVFYIGRDYFYLGYLTEQQLDWLQKDISFVPKGSTLVVTFHIPSALDTNDLKTFEYDNISKSMTNKKALYEMLQPYKVHLFSGHMHYSRNLVIAPNLYEHILSSVCGAWWQGPYAVDGTPKGYGVVEVNGDQVSWYFKTIGKAREHQFRAYPVGSNLEQQRYITVNVWNWDPEWKVFYYENGQKMGQMEQYSGIDPETAKTYLDKSRLAYQWISASKTDHLFRAVPKNPSAQIIVEIIDRFGNIYRENL